MRFILLDRVTELVPGERARGIKCVSLESEVVHDHFPGLPIFPGALLIEAAAQLSGLLVEVSRDRSRDDPEAPMRAVLAQVDKVKLHRLVEPGDRVELLARLESSMDAAAQVAVEAEVEGERAMRGRLTFLLRRVEAPEVHAQRRALYRLWTKRLVEEGRLELDGGWP